jgi:hypothetical protein
MNAMPVIFTHRAATWRAANRRVRATHLRGSAALLVGLLLSACGQEAPPEPTDSSYFPLVEGAFWRYDHAGNWVERVEVATATFQGQPAFKVSDSANPRDDLRSDSIIVVNNGRASRVSKDELLAPPGGTETLQSSVTYGVGFTRFNDAWATEGVGFSETPEYSRVETPAGESAQPAEDRRHTLEVVNSSVSVSTPAGTFNCVVVRRTKDWQATGTDTSDAQTKLFWFAPGVGKVREFNEETNNLEELIEFSIPEQAAP